MYLTPYEKDTYNLTFSEYCSVDPTPYDIVIIDNNIFVPCIVRAFNKCKAYTLKDLFNTNICDFLDKRDIGYKRLYVVIDFLTNIINGEIDYKALAFSQLKGVPYIVALNRTAICNGDFSSLNAEPQLQQLYKDAYYSVGAEMIEYCNNQEKITAFTNCLSNTLKQFDENNRRKQEISHLFDLVPSQRKGMKIINYISLYTQDSQQIRMLKNFFLENSYVLTNKGLLEIIKDNDLYLLVLDFLSWLRFPLKRNLNYIMRGMLANDSYKQILISKSNKMSNLRISKLLEISKKQLESLEKEMLNDFFYKKNGLLIFQILCLDLDGIVNITLKNLKEIFNCNYSKYLMYFKPFYCKLILEI